MVGRNCGYKFNEEQQRQKTLTIHQAVPAPVVRNIDFYSFFYAR
jgi:hypothetical protein